MNYEKFRGDITKIIDKQNVSNEKAIQKAYREAYLDIQKEIDLIYGKYLTGIDPKDYYTEMAKYNRLVSLNKAIAERLGISFKEYEKITTENIRMSLTQSYYYNQYANNWVLTYPVTILNEKAIDLSINYTQNAWKSFYGAAKTDAQVAIGQDILPQSGKTLKELYINNRALALKKVNDTVTHGLINGSSNTAMANSLKETFQKNLHSALTTTRTETHRNTSTGEYLNYLDSKKMLGNKVQRQILSVLDDRTRSQSAGMDGQIATEKGFLYPNGNRYLIPGNTGVPAYDINDRESVIEIIDGIEPETRIGRDHVTGKKEVFNYETFDTWAERKGLIKNRYGEILKK